MSILKKIRKSKLKRTNTFQNFSLILLSFTFFLFYFFSSERILKDMKFNIMRKLYLNSIKRALCEYLLQKEIVEIRAEINFSKNI